MENALWFDSFFIQNFALILGFLVVIAIPLYFLKSKKQDYQPSWASVKSWIVTLPFLFIFIGSPQPIPLIFLTLVSIYSAKRFFQMVGIYHKKQYVLISYFGIVACSVFGYYNLDALYLFAPSIILFLISASVIANNSSKDLIQYSSLTFIGFCLLGWNIVIAAQLFELPKGIYLLLYLYVLSEFAGNVTNGLSLAFPAPLVVSKISNKARWSGLVLSFALTLFLAWAFRRLLFNTQEMYWLSAGLICFFSAQFGEWTISAYRKDLGVKDQGVFIIGRGDLLSRSCKIMYAYPFYTFFLIFTGDLKFLIHS